jgi:hypothetical protein
MKAQVSLICYGFGGEQIARYDGPVADASFSWSHMAEVVGGWVVDFFEGKWVQLATDVENWLNSLGGDVKDAKSENVTFGLGGFLPDGTRRQASYMVVYFHAWTGDDIKPSKAGVTPLGPIDAASGRPLGIVDLGESRYTRGDFQYEYRYIVKFSMLPAGEYDFAFATGDNGTIQDATIGYTSGITVAPPAPGGLLSIDDKAAQLAAFGGFQLGSPTTVELVAPDGVGHYRHYQAGSLYWSPGFGAHLVHGLIRVKWADTGWERGFGYPLCDETPCPDGVGRYNHFQDASIFWTPRTGAHEVHGMIRQRWAELGWERSYLGYPTTDEIRMGDAADHRYSNFEHGSIMWTPQTGAIDSHNIIGASPRPVISTVAVPVRPVVAIETPVAPAPPAPPAEAA